MIESSAFYSHDWTKTPLGPVDGWPWQLRYMSEVLLHSKQAMFLLWGEQRLFIFNQAYQEIWGMDRAPVLGQPIQTVAGQAWDDLGPHVERAFAGESFCETDFPARSPDSLTLRYIDVSYTPIPGFESPEIVAVLCITNDATERVETAQRNREEREILSLTVENVAEGVALVEGDLSLVLWNEPFRIHFGYEPGEIQPGMNAMQLMLKTAQRGDLGPGDPMMLVQGLAHSIQTTESARMEIQRTNGTSLSLYRRTISGGRFLLVSQDVTDERRAARLKDELVSTVSHELRTPLTAISGALGLVGATGGLSGRAEHLVKIAQRNSDRLITLVNDLLDADKLQSGKVEFQRELLALNELVRMAMEQNTPAAEQASVALVAELPDESLFAQADRNRILQVLANLISNALKFSPVGERVVIRLRRNGASARVSVIDQGSGVAEAFRPRLFERFTQQDGTTSKVQQGTGLGLAISKAIAEAHGGTLQLDTETRRGATFHLDLPLAEPGDAAGLEGG